MATMQMERMGKIRKQRTRLSARDSAKWDRSDELFYSESNMRALDEADRQLREGRVVVVTMEELEAMANA